MSRYLTPQHCLLRFLYGQLTPKNFLVSVPLLDSPKLVALVSVPLLDSPKLVAWLVSHYLTPKSEGEQGCFLPKPGGLMAGAISCLRGAYAELTRGELIASDNRGLRSAKNKDDMNK